MPKKQKSENSLLYSPFELSYGANTFHFDDVEEFVRETGISGAVALDLLTGAAKSYKRWTNPKNQLE